MLGQVFLTFGVLFAFFLTSCTVWPTELGFPPGQWQAMNTKKREQLQANYYQIRSTSQLRTIYQGPRIQVALFGGTAMMPPLFQAYYFESVRFKTDPGKCQHIQLMSWDEARSVKLKVCYDGMTLSLDPSYYDLTKTKGTLLLTYNILWKHGFTYNNLSSSGYVRLKNTDVTVKIISDEASKNDYTVSH